jgi:hypothetical protein
VDLREAELRDGAFPSGAWVGLCFPGGVVENRENPRVFPRFLQFRIVAQKYLKAATNRYSLVS